MLEASRSEIFGWDSSIQVLRSVEDMVSSEDVDSLTFIYKMTSSPASFTLFGRLPAEIRCEIWKFAAPGPRIVAVKFGRNKAQYQPRIRTPSILRVSQESRHEALKIYRELLLGPGRNIGCYMDIDRDTVYVKGDLIRSTNRISTLYISAAPPSPDIAGHSEPLPLLGVESDKAGFERILPAGREGTTRTNYTELILDDLMTSPDGKAMLEDLHVDFDTWQLLRKKFWRYRHEYPRYIKKLTIISERGDGPLTDIKMHDIRDVPTLPDGAETLMTERRNSYLIRMKTSFIAISAFRNRRDKAAGLPQVLTRSISMKLLYKGDDELEV